MCGVRPYIRATCNPQTEGFVRDLVDWWIGSDGLPREERSGAIRYAVRDGDTLLQFDQLEHIPIKRRDEAKTISFINSSVYDNEVLLKNDPGYLANLKSLPRYDREQLLNGNWNIRREAGMYFRESWFEIVEKVPPAEEINMVCCRYWDRAATTPKEGLDPDYTVGLKLGRSGDTFYVLDVIRIRETPLFVAKRIKSASMMDGYSCTVGLEQEGGASGIAECDYLKRDLEFPNVEVAKAEKSKEWRCKPVSAASEQGRVKLLLAPWNKAFLSELENFPLGAHDDQVDALSGAFNMLDRKPDYSVYKSLARARGLI
jgi:predicted phage terminase large subunit-like protein